MGVGGLVVQERVGEGEEGEGEGGGGGRGGKSTIIPSVLSATR